MEKAFIKRYITEEKILKKKLFVFILYRHISNRLHEMWNVTTVNIWRKNEFSNAHESHQPLRRNF